MNDSTVAPGRPISRSVTIGRPCARNSSASASYFSTLMLDLATFSSVTGSVVCNATDPSAQMPAPTQIRTISVVYFTVFLAKEQITCWGAP